MKVAIITANFGGFDKDHPFVEQSIPCDRLNFTEQNSPFPLRGMDPRMQAKYFKLQMHRFLNYDFFIWHDGSIEITSKYFASYMVNHASSYDITITKHYKRPNVEEELLFILDGIGHKDPYLCARYRPEPIQAELDFFRSKSLEKLPLYACGLFAFANNEKNQASMNEWWEKTMQYSVLDQCMFSYAFRNSRINPIEFNLPYDLGLTVKHPHNEGH